MEASLVCSALSRQSLKIPPKIWKTQQKYCDLSAVVLKIRFLKYSLGDVDTFKNLVNTRCKIYLSSCALALIPARGHHMKHLLALQTAAVCNNDLTRSSIGFLVSNQLLKLGSSRTQDGI